MTKTLNQIIIFFLHQNQNIFFSNIGNQNIFVKSGVKHNKTKPQLLAQGQDNVTVWSDMSTCSADCCFSEIALYQSN
jgi:hypothetical protein